jgi:hypothetical protein
MDHCGSKSLQRIHLLATHLGYVDSNQPVLKSLPIPLEGVDKIKTILRDQINAIDAAAYLNIIRRHLREMTDRKIINDITIKSQGRTTSILLRSTLDAFLARLFGLSQEVEITSDEILTIAQAARRNAIHYVDIIQGILDGKIQVVGRNPKVAGVPSVLVSREDVRKLRAATPTMYPILQAAEIVGQKYHYLAAATRAGFVSSIPDPNAKAPTARLVALDECKRFFQEYVLARELADRLGRPVPTISRILVLSEVESLTADGVDAQFYHREAAERVLREWDWTVDLLTRRLILRKQRAEESARLRPNYEKIEIPHSVLAISRDQAQELLRSHFVEKVNYCEDVSIRGRRIDDILKDVNGEARVVYEISMNGRFLVPEKAIKYLYLIHASSGEMSVIAMRRRVGGCTLAAGALYRFIMDKVSIKVASGIVAEMSGAPSR